MGYEEGRFLDACPACITNKPSEIFINVVPS